MTPKLGLVFVVLFGVAVADLAFFKKCEEHSDDICEVTEVRITPCVNKYVCKLKKGTQSVIDFDFIPKFDASNLTTTLFWASDGGDIPFVEFQNVNACQYTSCPLEAGKKQALNYSLYLNKMLPNGKYVFKWELWNSEDQTKACCFKTTVQLRR